MNKTLLREWKKVFLPDLTYVCYELQDLITKPALIILEGEVGAGKTTFCQAFLQAETFSPTYSILTETHTTLHGDFYRLKSVDELTHLELPMYLEGKNYFFVEWGLDYAQNVYRQLPESFSCYYMQVDINPESEKEGETGEFSRNFFFHSLTFDD